MTLEKLKVCMLIPSYFPHVGGAEVQLSGLIKKLDPGKFNAFILTRKLKGTSSRESEGRSPVIRTRAPIAASSFFFTSLLFLIRNRKLFDILHVYSFDSPALTGAIIKKLLPNKKFVLRVPRYGPGSAFMTQEKSFIGRLRMKFILMNVDAIIPLNAEVVKALCQMELNEEKIASIPNGVDTEVFAPPSQEKKKNLRKSFGIDPDAFAGIFAGRLIKRKNVMAILRLWQDVVKNHCKAVFLVAGSGPEEERLKAYAGEHLPRGSVLFFGCTDRGKIANLLQAADVYVSFSESEGMSNAMLEALSSGLPIIATRGPGIDQMVKEGKNGFLVDGSQSREALPHLRLLAGNEAKRLAISRSARAFIENHFSFDMVARKIEALYLGESLRDEPQPEHPAIPDYDGAKDKVEARV